MLCRRYLMNRVFRLCVLFICYVRVNSKAIPATDVRQLFNDLLNDYDTRLRPLHDLSQSVNVSVHFTPLFILELDTASQKFTFTGLFAFDWEDDHMRWNLSASHGLERLMFPLNEIWHPTFVMSVSYSGRPTIGNDKDKISVSNDGQVSWMTEGSFTLVCDIDISFYPFDTQECKIYLYVSDVTASEVQLIMRGDGIETIADLDGPEWLIIDRKAETVSMHGAKIIKYSILLQRRASFTMYTIIGPLLVLSILNTIAFLVPIESGEKGSIVMTLLLSFCVYVSSLSMILPANSQKTSYLLIFMTILEANSAVAVVYTMIQSMLFSRRCMQGNHGNIMTILRCCKPSDVDIDITAEMSKTETTDIKQNDNDSLEDKTRRFRRMDTVMFILFLSCNVILVVAFAYEVKRNLREKL